MWVKGHQGIEGNEKVDERSKEKVEMGWRIHVPDAATPTGIRQAYPMHPKAPAHMRGPRRRLEAGLYGDGQRTTASVAIGDWESWCVCDIWTP